MFDGGSYVQGLRSGEWPQTPADLRRDAAHYRRLMRSVNDEHVLQVLQDLAGELEFTAAELERRKAIRVRAHEIWVEHGKPDGQELEHWLQAEREIQALFDGTGRFWRG